MNHSRPAFLIRVSMPKGAKFWLESDLKFDQQQIWNVELNTGDTKNQGWTGSPKVIGEQNEWWKEADIERYEVYDKQYEGTSVPKL